MASTKKDRFCYRTPSLSPSTKINNRFIYCLKAIESAKTWTILIPPFVCSAAAKNLRLLQK